MPTEITSVRLETEPVPALNNLLTRFKTEFTRVVKSSLLKPQEKIESGAEILARYHLEVMPIVESIGSLELVMIQWSSIGTDDPLIQDSLGGKGVFDKDSLGHLWGIRVEESMAERFAELLQESDYYRQGGDLPLPLWELV